MEIQERHMRKNSSQEAPAALRTHCSAVMIVNPTSGSYIYHRHQLVEAIAFLRHAGWKIEFRLTKEASDAGRVAREAVEQNADVVIAVGGDGTINEVIQQLAGSETALGVLPIGTVNVWAREINIPLDIAHAREVLLYGTTRSIDLGKVNDRYFLLMAGIGFDAEVARAIEKKPIKRLGVLGYLLVGTWLGLGYESFRVYLTINRHLVKKNALQVVVGNTQLYGGTIKYTWQAKCDDGLLDVCIVRKRSMLGRIVVGLDFLLRREQRRQWVSYEKCEAVEVRTRKPIAIQVDGDSMGYTPAKITIAPRALKVIVPQQVPKGLFSQG
jgi:diacylglycerol kinase (ATP)